MKIEIIDSDKIILSSRKGQRSLMVKLDSDNDVIYINNYNQPIKVVQQNINSLMIKF